MHYNYLLRAVLGIAVFFACLVHAQEATWVFEHRVDYFIRRDADTLMIHGHFLSPLPASHDEGTPTLTLSCSGGLSDAVIIYVLRHGSER